MNFYGVLVFCRFKSSKKKKLTLLIFKIIQKLVIIKLQITTFNRLFAENYVIMWKKVTSDQPKFLAVGKTIMGSKDRMSVQLNHKVLNIALFLPDQSM